jgi:hypothetical protein
LGRYAVAVAFGVDSTRRCRRFVAAYSPCFNINGPHYYGRIEIDFANPIFTERINPTSSSGESFS